MDPIPGGVPTVAGRTPIACQNCASAKTGCDKRVPCSRCAEKSLPCAARFARRASKAAVRASQASVAFQQQMMPVVVGHQQQPAPAMNFMDLDPLMSKQQNSPSQLLNMSPMGPLDPAMNDGTHRHHSPTHSHHGSADFPSPLHKMDGMDGFMQLDSGDFMTPAIPYHDMMGWQDYTIDFDMYSNPLPLMQDLPLPMLGDMSDVASVSEPLTGTSSRASTHTRSTSIMSSADFEPCFKPVEPKHPTPPGAEAPIPEFDVMLAAEDHWSMARVNPTVGTCPRTAIVHLECLEEKCKQEGTWDALAQYISKANYSDVDLAATVPMTDRTRDRMLAVTQSFLQKALEIHRGGSEGRRSSITADFFIVLPPGNILEYFLRSYVRSLTYYFSLTGGGGGLFDPNEMLVNNKASTLLVLLMIAQGAAAVPTAEARYLSAGLIETCRISLFDMIEKDVELAADPVVLRCALLLMNLGTWSGDKWLQDIAMGQRGMYLSVSDLSFRR
jgi:Zn(2)-Cys(6) binuclear cluster domain-containing protein